MNISFEEFWAILDGVSDKRISESGHCTMLSPAIIKQLYEKLKQANDRPKA